MTAKDDLKLCLSALSRQKIARLHRHLERGMPVLCGCEQAGDYFVYEGRCDPVILACFETYPRQTETYHGLHQQTQDVYDSVAEMLNHSGYACALEQLTQWDVKQIVKELYEHQCE